MLNADETVPHHHKLANRLVARGLRRRWLLMSVLVAALLAVVTTSLTGQAATAQTTPSACLSGYVCLVLAPSGTGNVALVAAGQSQSFRKPGVPVTELANNTTTFYCLEEWNSNGVTIFSDIAADSTKTVSANMAVVFPGPACPL